MKAIAYICLTIGIISIISATTLALVAVWMGRDATTWKGLITCGILFLAALLAAIINQVTISGLDRNT